MKIHAFFFIVIFCSLMTLEAQVRSDFPDVIFDHALEVPTEDYLDPCSQVNPSGGFQFFGNMYDDLQLLANDVYVEPNEIFSLEQIITNLASIEGVTHIDVSVWEDDNGLPWFSTLTQTVMPTSQTLIGTSPVGANVYETVLDLPNSIELEGGENGTTYWIQLYGFAINTEEEVVAWETTSDTSVGYKLAVRDENFNWLIETVIDGVNIFNGECTPVLATGDHLKSKLSIFPNPTSGRITLKGIDTIPREAILYDILGNAKNVQLHNDVLDISHEQSGLYFLHLETSLGTMVKRIIKE